MKKRAQSPLELMLAYTVVVLIIALGTTILYSAGILTNPADSRFLPDICQLGPHFTCRDFKAEAAGGSLLDLSAGKVQILVKNTLGADLDLFLIYINGDEGKGACAGYTGIIAHPILKPTLFTHDSIEKLQTTADKDGIHCGITGDCCDSVLLPNGKPACLTSCALAEPLPAPNEKFRKPITLVYRLEDSPIIHKKQGYLAVTVEAP